MPEPTSASAERPRPHRVEPRRAHTGLGLLLAGPLLGLLLVGALGLATINEVRVGGPQDTRVAQADELVADTTAPSQDLSSLRGTLLLLPEVEGTPQEDALRTQVDTAESRYREGHAYWDSHLSDPALRDSLLVEAHQPVATLFRLVHEELWPAMDHGDRVDANAIVRDDLLPLLERHEQAIERVSAQASDVRTATRSRADDAITLRTRLLMAVLAGVMALVVIAAVAALRLTRRAEPGSESGSGSDLGVATAGAAGADPAADAAPDLEPADAIDRTHPDPLDEPADLTLLSFAEVFPGVADVESTEPV